jgi:hypothetical protein
LFGLFVSAAPEKEWAIQAAMTYNNMAICRAST